MSSSLIDARVPLSQMSLAPALVMTLSLTFPLAVLAQTPANPPDAGRILDSVRPQPAPTRPAPAIEFQQENRPAFKGDGGFRTRISRVRVTGSSMFPEATLLPIVQSLVGKDATLADLEAAATALTRFYRENGHFVTRAYVPQQEIENGVVEIAILEGRYAEITVHGPGNRLAKSAEQSYLDAYARKGDVVHETSLERAMMLMNDFPSVDVKAVLRPGSAIGTSNLDLTTTEGHWLSGGLDADNYGNKYSGRYRLGASLYLNSPTGYGDQLSLRANSARGVDYYGAGYQIPILYSGLKVGVAVSDLHYKLGEEFTAGNFTGESQTYGAFLTYPFVRSRRFNVWGKLALDHKHFENRAGAATLSDKNIDAWSLALAVEGRDKWGGVNDASLTLHNGRLNLDGFAADRVADSTTVQAHGNYSKVSYHIARVQQYAASPFSWLVELNGQWASKNLDSSERMALGGYSGVRGYAQGEAIGDSAAILTAEARWDLGVRPLGGGVRLSAFADNGWVQLHQNTWTGWQGGNPNLANAYHLSSAGLGATWAKLQSFSVRANVSHTLGSNRGVDINGRDSENGGRKTRLWLQGVMWF